MRDRMRYLSSLHGSAVAWGGEAVSVLVSRECRVATDAISCWFA